MTLEREAYDANHFYLYLERPWSESAHRYAPPVLRQVVRMLLLSSRRKSVGDCGYLPQELWLGVFRCMHRDWVREPRPTRGTAQAEYVHERGLAVGIEAAAACHLVLAENRVEAPSRAPSGEAPSRAPSGEAPSRAPSGEAPSRAAENWVEALDGAPSRALGGEAPSRAPDGAPHDEAPYRAPDGAPYRAPDGAPHRDPNTGTPDLERQRL
ncbi:fibrinogen-binding, partial [Chrysochromulina tobinii]